MKFVSPKKWEPCFEEGGTVPSEKSRCGISGNHLINTDAFFYSRALVLESTELIAPYSVYILHLVMKRILALLNNKVKLLEIHENNVRRNWCE